MEHNEKTDLWIDIGTNQTVTFWPETSSMQMYVKYRDSKLISQTFNFATPNSTVLRMDKGVKRSNNTQQKTKNYFRGLLKLK